MPLPFALPAPPQARGAQITIPTSRGGFSIATRVSTDVNDMWSFTRRV